MANKTAPASLHDPRITEFGMFVEANRRIGRLIETSLRNKHNMTEVQFEAMLRIGRSPEQRMSMTDLANQMVLTSGGVTRLIDRLAAVGYVGRVACPEDRRVQWAQLTDDGVAKIAEVLDTHLDDLERHFFSAMSPDERAALIPVLERLRRACRED